MILDFDDASSNLAGVSNCFTLAAGLKCTEIDKLPLTNFPGEADVFRLISPFGCCITTFDFRDKSGGPRMTHTSDDYGTGSDGQGEFFWAGRNEVWSIINLRKHVSVATPFLTPTIATIPLPAGPPLLVSGLFGLLLMRRRT